MVSIAIIGQEGSGRSSLAAKLGKKGNVTDITMYDFVKGEQILTIIDSSGYPASPKPLMTGLAMCEIVLLCIPPGEIHAATGESVIAVDLMGINRGIIIQTFSDTSNPYELEERTNQIRSLLQGTIARHWGIVPVSTTTFQGMDRLKEAINTLDKDVAARNLLKADVSPRVVVDHSFNVKGIGSVVLGRVIQGTIHKHDKLTIHPIGQEIEIRNIQMHDVDTISAGPGSRVGLALKGVQAKDVERGHIISEGEISTDNIELICKISTFSPGLNAGGFYHMYVNLQSAPVKVSTITINGKHLNEAPAGSECRLTVTAGEAMSFNNEDVFILADLNNLKQRFVAGGRIMN